MSDENTNPETENEEPIQDQPPAADDAHVQTSSSESMAGSVDSEGVEAVAPALPKKKRRGLILGGAVVAVAVVGGVIAGTVLGSSVSGGGDAKAFESCTTLQNTVQTLSKKVTDAASADAATKELAATIKQLAEADKGSKFASLADDFVAAYEKQDSNAGQSTSQALVEYCTPIIDAGAKK